jgi:hypothetical protein
MVLFLEETSFQIVKIAYLLEDKIGVTATNTLDGSDGEHDVPLAVNVGVHNTQNVLERGRDYQRHLGSRREN